jgi:hypothetical protein
MVRLVLYTTFSQLWYTQWLATSTRVGQCHVSEYGILIPVAQPRQKSRPRNAQAQIQGHWINPTKLNPELGPSARPVVYM